MGEKNHGDSKYDSQFALRAFPDYENLSRRSLDIASIFSLRVLLRNVR